ncbi:hypothetical protein [Marilutibacter maris]|uniref:hypothetical protein n=1 Tax=Marilutibacter maris TaxID=1605891 RepID=UPI0011AE9171|nr:hypothetical protein [Lysobacter maris]
MNNHANKKNEEHVFCKFMEITGVPASSIAQEEPPKPDITCKISGLEVGFELMALTDRTIERKFGSGESHGSNFKIEISDVIACINRKSGKNYSMEDIELLIHEGSTPLDDLWRYNQSDLNAQIQQATNKSPFSRVWILDISNSIARSFVPKASLAHSRKGQGSAA